MKVKDLIKELSHLDKNMEVYTITASEDTFHEVTSLEDLFQYEEKELVEDEDGYVFDLETDLVEGNSVVRKFNALVVYVNDIEF